MVLHLTAREHGHVVCKEETHGVRFLGASDAWVPDLVAARVFDSHFAAERTMARVHGDCTLPLGFARRNL